MNQKKLTIVTITFNNYDELIKTLESIADHNEAEILVINGGTCLKTLEFLKTFKGKSVSKKDNGIADAFNKGAMLSTGKYIHYLNSGDCFIDKNVLKKIIDSLNEKPFIDYLYTDILYDHVNYGQMRITPHPKAQKNMVHGMPFNHPGLIVSRRVFQEIGYFSEKFKIAMDYDFILRMRKKKLKGTYLKILTVKMNGNGISSRKPLLSIWENFQSLRNNQMLSLYAILVIMYKVIRSSLALVVVKAGGKRILKIYHKKSALN